MKKELPSGAKLEITLAPFEDANNLRRAVASELKKVQVTSETELTEANFVKELLCTGLASREIEEAIWICLKRCLYNEQKITPDLFEPADKRGDYLPICIDVATENLAPFMKGLLSQLKTIFKGKALLG